MNKLILLELLLAGFFAVACLRARIAPSDRGTPKLIEFFRLSGRLERLRRSRWQWFSMASLMLVLRLQHELPLSIEIMVVAQFLIFMSLPTQRLKPKVWAKNSI